MLVLSRKVGEELVIGDNIRIVVSRITGNRVSIGIQAPDSVHIIRSELQAIREGFNDQKDEQVSLCGLESPHHLSTPFDAVAGAGS
jgi:carbon storage regulator CsrA